MAKMGFRKLSDMIGRCDVLEPAQPLNAKVKVSKLTLCPSVHLSAHPSVNKLVVLGPHIDLVCKAQESNLKTRKRED